MKLKTIVICLLVAFSQGLNAQVSQNIKGKVIDADSKSPLVGVTVKIADTVGMGAITDAEGFFTIGNVPIGRYTLEFTYMGYEPLTIPNVVVTSGKETFLPISLTEKASDLGTVKVTSVKQIGSYNDMATVSSRTFNAAEAERYPGSRQDPARMASNFAGVQGTDDSRNDIVVRGNSPLGVLWRFEGIDIPNPSHFSIAGTTGGPLSILNNKVIGHSDFMTGAFPSEYGNALSGVFDIRMRSGNRETYEHTAQIGVLGLELMSEGPINKENKSSYIVTYRYSTFSVFKAINFNLGTDAVPNYQDASFKLNFPNKKNGTFSIWGIGGLSHIDIKFSDKTEPQNDLYGENDRDQYFTTNMFTVGATYSAFFKNDLSTKLVIAQSGQEIIADHDFIIWDSLKATQKILQLDSLYPVLRSRMYEGKTSLHWILNKKFNARNTTRFGIIGELFQINYLDSSTNEFKENWIRKLDANDMTYMLRAYVSHKYRITADLTFNGGVHFLYLEQSNQFVAEPRAGLAYKAGEKTNLSIGYGMHSRMQPMYVYYYKFFDTTSNPGNPTLAEHNNNIGMTKSQHLVASMDYIIDQFHRVKIEAFYQYLYQVPVESKGGTFSLINQGSGFTRFFPEELENTGVGQNYGIEITLERFFHKHYFFLANMSLYESVYKGKSDIEWRNTDFNGNYIINGLFGYEKALSSNGKHIISAGSKITFAGGKRYSPVDTAATRANGIQVIFIQDERNTLQFPYYLRWDIKLGYKINGKNATHEISLDLLNVLGRKNLLTVVFANDPDNPGTKVLRDQPQLGFLPLLYYKVDF